MHPYEVLRRPIRTEKIESQIPEGQYTFEVDKRANKLQIKEAVERAFDVTVVKVNVMNMPGKTRRHGRRVSQTPSWKKATVTLAAGDRLDIFEGV